MKKLLKDFLAASLILCIILSVSGCAAPEKKTASFEELSRNGAVYSGLDDMAYFGTTIDATLERQKGWTQTVASGRVNSVRYYYSYDSGLNFVYGFTVCEIEITSVPDIVNTAGLSEGDTVRTFSNYFPAFSKDGQIDENKVYEYYGKQINVDINCRDDFNGLDSFEFEFIPPSGEDYIFNLWEQTLPFEVGKEYAFLLILTYEDREGFGALYGTEIVYPLDGSETLEVQCEKYGVHFDPEYLMIANDLKKLFTDA
ncbi:MAG: hypothetical protein IJM18_02430 [Clostridia bacterium]|nr:hypothetical protein [Clostridia bacterium]